MRSTSRARISSAWRRRSRDERLDLELAVAARERLDLVLDDRLDARHLAQARRDRVVEPGAQVVDVEEPDAGNVAGAALDVGRNGEVDEHERALVAARHRRLQPRPPRRPALSELVAVTTTSAHARASPSSSSP